MYVSIDTTLQPTPGAVTLPVIYEEVQAAEAEAYDSDAPISPTIAAAVKQYTPLPGGGFRSLQSLLALLCVPATRGRSQRMLDLIEANNIDWPTAFERTAENSQADSGQGKRTRAYERIKKARQRVINAAHATADATAGTAASFVISGLSPSLLATCVTQADAWMEENKAPGPALRAIAARLVNEAAIDDTLALQRTVNAVLREAALRFASLHAHQENSDSA